MPCGITHRGLSTEPTTLITSNTENGDFEEKEGLINKEYILNILTLGSNRHLQSRVDESQRGVRVIAESTWLVH